MLLFCFFMWFARYQILVWELQSIWRKLLVLSCLQQFNKFFKILQPRPDLGDTGTCVHTTDTSTCLHCALSPKRTATRPKW